MPASSGNRTTCTSPAGGVLNHSPAPWTVREGPFGHTFIECQSGHTVAGIALSCDGPQPAANTALISAAPELYKFARIFMDDDGHLIWCPPSMRDATGCSPACELVRAALAKAEGRTP